MENLNLAELLRDCPKGMELDCTMFDNVTFVRVDYERKQFPIEISISGLRSKYLTKEGSFYDTTLLPEAKSVIFPKGKTTWEGFQRPFKDGDILSYQYKGFKNRSIYIYMYHNRMNTTYYVALSGYSDSEILINNEEGHALNSYNDTVRLATEEEKQKLFDAIKANGYKWNAETKTLEKLVEPIFKVGNKIEKCGYRFTIAQVKDDYYLTKCGNKIPFDNQDDFSLVSNKFDITTLKPFDKVLYRMHHNDTWLAGFYNVCIKNKFFVIGLGAVPYYIPYENNEHLLGTTNDCDPFFKTWENNN